MDANDAQNITTHRFASAAPFHTDIDAGDDQLPAQTGRGKGCLGVSELHFALCRPQNLHAVLNAFSELEVSFEFMNHMRLCYGVIFPGNMEHSRPLRSFQRNLNLCTACCSFYLFFFHVSSSVRAASFKTGEGDLPTRFYIQLPR